MRKSLVGQLILALCILTTRVSAHEGEDHGAPALATSAGESRFQSVSGTGTAFEAVLKYEPFVPGSSVPLTLYVLSLDSNRPVSEASITGTLSSGDLSADVEFKPGTSAGAYTAAAAPGGSGPWSWLFDITADGGSDLIGVSGFAADASLGTEPPGTAGAASRSNLFPFPSPVAAVAAGALLLVAGFGIGRATAKRGTA
ncbi:hypothetical protein HZA57_06165 [Candidatus Poribacteria bacterium]|nr:hypothetical protein [Candidatus Poribacteria bacterium]